MPPTQPVEPVQSCEQGSWVQQLGGRSLKTKNARSATPMGFAHAVYQSNAGATSQSIVTSRANEMADTKS
jgi:hypothetical protein